MTTSSTIRLRSAQAAQYLGISRSTLAKWRMRKVGPPAHRCGPRIIFYLEHEITAWLEECDASGAADQVRR